MPTKHYRLKLEHPYAKAGMIVEECQNEGVLNHTTYSVKWPAHVEVLSIPDAVKDQWLEEVKEEPTCSKEFAEALKVESERAFRVGARGYLVTEEWLNQHTAKEE